MMKGYVPIISGKDTAKVCLDDIVCIEREGRKLHVVTVRREYWYYEKIEIVERYLDERFFPCLKGCYVNLEHIAYMEEQEIHFDNGYAFFLGRSNFIKTKQRYKLFLRTSQNA